MAIIKPGFTPGFRGRRQPATLSRRVFYLVAEEGRDSARILGVAGKEVTPAQGIESMGGSFGVYHEVILSPSDAECKSIRSRIPEDPRKAADEAGLRVTRAYASGRPFLLAIHEQDGRFHFHLVVAGPQSETALGKHGQIKKHWDREFFGDEPRIQDWAAHLRFQEERSKLQQIIRQQKENECQRRQAVKSASPGKKAAAARPFEVKARELIEHRHDVELRAIHARYESRGSLGNPRHRAEVEQSEHRHTGALRRLEQRETERELRACKAQIGRAVDGGGRAIGKSVGLASSITRKAVDHAMRELGVPAPARHVTRAGLALAQESIQTALRASQEAAKGAAKSSVHVAQASVKLGIGLVAAIPTAGASLESAGKETGQDLAKAGNEMGQGLLQAGVEVGKGAGRAAVSSAQELMPKELRMAAQVAMTGVRTAANATKDLVSLSPMALTKTLAGGALDLGKSAANAAGLKTSLPEPLRRAFQVAGWIPVAGIAARATELAAETAQTAISAASRGMEVDR